MSKKVIFLVVFFLFLVTGFFFVMSKLIPGFSSSKLPPISYVQPFAFRNQDGKVFTNRDVVGKVYVAEFFFTTCKGICPKLNTNLTRVYERFKNEDNFLILSHTCDPTTDSVSRLKSYADSLNVSSARWVFLTGRKDSLYSQARLSYQIDDPKNNLRNINDDFLHTQFFALVDRQGRVRKIIDGLKPSEVDEMMNDVERLLKEK